MEDSKARMKATRTKRTRQSALPILKKKASQYEAGLYNLTGPAQAKKKGKTRGSQRKKQKPRSKSP